MHGPRWLCAVVALALVETVTAQGWRQLSTGVAPASRQSHGLALDPLRGQVLLFGGILASNFSNLNDTWRFAQGAWTQLNPTNPPSVRDTFALGFDPGSAKFVLFGGERLTGQVTLGDAHTFDPITAQWSPLAVPPSLTPRVGARMATDSTRGLLVMFGGQQIGSRRFDETWEYDSGLGWRRILTVHAPSPRNDVGIAFDPLRNRVVLHGGQTGGNRFSNETWEYDGFDWTRVADGGCGPSPRARATFGYCATTGTCLLHGGHDAGTLALFDETWEWDGRLWRRYDIPIGPGGRSNAALTTMPSGDALLFGGSKFSSNPSETWAFGGTTLASVASSGCGCATSNGVLRLSAVPATALPTLGSNFAMGLGNAIGISSFVYSIAEPPVPLPLAAIGAPGCSLYVGATFATALGPTTVLPITTDPILRNALLYVQGVSLDAASASIATSNSLRLIVR